MITWELWQTPPSTCIKWKGTSTSVLNQEYFSSLDDKSMKPQGRNMLVEGHTL